MGEKFTALPCWENERVQVRPPWVTLPSVVAQIGETVFLSSTLLTAWIKSKYALRKSTVSTAFDESYLTSFRVFEVKEAPMYRSSWTNRNLMGMTRVWRYQTNLQNDSLTSTCIVVISWEYYQFLIHTVTEKGARHLIWLEKDCKVQNCLSCSSKDSLTQKLIKKEHWKRVILHSGNHLKESRDTSSLSSDCRCN